MNIFTEVSDYLVETQGLFVDWSAYRVSVCEEKTPKGYIKVWGAVAPFMKSKPTRRDWRKMTQKSVHFVDKAALDIWFEKKCVEKNICPDCEGTGQRWVSWSVVDGNKTKPCRRCGESGRYAAKERAK